MKDTAWEALAAFHRRQRRLARKRKAGEVLRYVVMGALAATILGILVSRS